MRRARVSVVSVSAAAALVLGACGGGGSSAAKASSAATGSGGWFDDLCEILPPTDVSLGATITEEAEQKSTTSCLYDMAANGLFLAMTLTKLAKADQASFDAQVKTMGSSMTLSPVTDLGDGTAQLGRNPTDPGVTVFARKGSEMLSLTLLAGSSDLPGTAKDLAAKALSRL